MTVKLIFKKMDISNTNYFEPFSEKMNRDNSVFERMDFKSSRAYAMLKWKWECRNGTHTFEMMGSPL